jgi:hypothetical protein
MFLMIPQAYILKKVRIEEKKFLSLYCKLNEPEHAECGTRTEGPNVCGVASFLLHMREVPGSKVGPESAVLPFFLVSLGPAWQMRI